MRDMVFISHANPEDNEFALWLALRLAADGYPVWCDLTKLLGGEVFWSDIEIAIRQRTAKFLYVLNRTSNEKPGPRSELAIAIAVERREQLKDFIVPLWIDDLSSQDFNVEIFRRNATRFQDGWARGLALVLKKLEEDGVPKKPTFGPSAVTAWWREHVNAMAGVRQESEPLYTNWYPLAPTTLYFHELERTGTGAIKVPDRLPYPGVQHNQYLVSFAPAADFDGCLGPDISIVSTAERRVNDPDSPAAPRLWSHREERQHLTNLLRQTWEHWLRVRTLPTYEFANQRKAFYFVDGMVPNDRVFFTAYDGSRGRRDMIGFRTIKSSGPEDDPTRRYWHFSLEARPTSTPFVGYTMKPHVLFSNDAQTIWVDTDSLHRARRSQCKNWWNDRWRDLIAAAVSFLAADSEFMRIPVGSTAELLVAARPITVTSPVSFDEASLEPQEVESNADDDGLESGEEAEETILAVADGACRVDEV